MVNQKGRDYAKEYLKEENLHTIEDERRIEWIAEHHTAGFHEALIELKERIKEESKHAERATINFNDFIDASIIRDLLDFIDDLEGEI